MGEFDTVMQTRDEVEAGGGGGGLGGGVCITVENSLNPRVFMSSYANTGKKFSIVFIIYFFPRKNAKLFIMALIKKLIPTSREVLYTKSVLVLQKRGFSKYVFLSLKTSA